MRRNLKVQAAQNPPRRPRVVVLHKDDVVTDRVVEQLLVEAFDEKTARVTEHLGLKNQHACNGGGGHFHVVGSFGMDNASIGNIGAAGRILKTAVPGPRAVQHGRAIIAG